MPTSSQQRRYSQLRPKLKSHHRGSEKDQLKADRAVIPAQINRCRHSQVRLNSALCPTSVVKETPTSFPTPHLAATTANVGDQQPTETSTSCQLTSITPCWQSLTHSQNQTGTLAVDIRQHLSQLSIKVHQAIMCRTAFLVPEYPKKRQYKETSSSCLSCTD